MAKVNNALEHVLSGMSNLFAHSLQKDELAIAN